jgi:hypothetical protein
MSDFDIYTGWIVALVDGQWRKVHISPGFVTIADWWEPNNHIGVFTEEEAAKAINGEESNCKPIERSPYALIADVVRDQDVLDRVAFVRFGRDRARSFQGMAIVDSMDAVRRYIGCGFDDTDGINPDWPRDPVIRTGGFGVVHSWDRLLKGPINFKFRED